MFACESARTDHVSRLATNVATNFNFFQNITSLLAATYSPHAQLQFSLPTTYFFLSQTITHHQNTNHQHNTTYTPESTQPPITITQISSKCLPPTSQPTTLPATATAPPAPTSATHAKPSTPLSRLSPSEPMSRPLWTCSSRPSNR